MLTSTEYVRSYTVEPGGDADVVVIGWRPATVAWEPRRRNVFDLQDGILEVMKLYLDSDVKLEQVVERHGAPDKAEAGLSMHPEPVYVSVHAFYRELGMMVELHLPADDPTIRPKTNVIRVWYFEPAPLDKVYAALQGKKGKPLEDFELEWLQDWRDWRGYGLVEPTY